MPWIAESGNSYNLCLLDTNALSEIVKHPEDEGRGFKQNFSPSSNAPCFTVYNLFELRRKPDLFKAFVAFFRIYPCFLLKPHPMILDEERRTNGNTALVSPLMNAFSQEGVDLSYDFEYFMNRMFASSFFLELEHDWRDEETATLAVWMKRKENFNPKRPVPNASDADEYLEEAGMQSLIASDLEWARKEIGAGRVPNINHFPSLQVVLYSQYYRLYDPHWRPKPQDVTDLLIVSVTPYMDAVITEAFQAEILKKIRKKVLGLDNLQVATLRDIRFKADD